MKEQVHGVLVMILLQITGVIIAVIIIFGVDKSSSSHTGNCNNNFLEFSEGPTDVINDNLGAAEKNYYSINFTKAKFCLSLHYNGDDSYLLAFNG